jgi:hypothetical protein
LLKLIECCCSMIYMCLKGMENLRQSHITYMHSVYFNVNPFMYLTRLGQLKT